MLIEIKDCWQCPIRKEYRSTFCPLIGNADGKHVTVIYFGKEPELHKECPMKKYEYNHKLETNRDILP